MTSDEDKKEIVVRAPSKPVVSPEEKARKITERALEEERFGVLKFPKRVSKYLGVTVAGTGVLLLFLFVYMSATGQTSGVLLSGQASLAVLAVWGFVGLINIIIGFIFMGRE